MGRWANKYVIGLTGNIGMGKSLVRKMLEHLGAYTIDADGLAHQVMAPGAPAYAPAIDTFGKWILDKEGRVDRTKLGAVVFSHPEALARLEALTHPIVGQGIDTLVSRAKQPIVVIEAIKLIEGVLAQQVDSIWVVDAAMQIQLERLISKRGMTDYEARKRVDTQNPQRDKLARATVVISNNGTAEDAWVQVQREWNKILALRNVAQTTADDDFHMVSVGQPALAQPAPIVTAPVQPIQTMPAAPAAPVAPAKPVSTDDTPTLPSRPTLPKPPTTEMPAVVQPPAAAPAPVTLPQPVPQPTAAAPITQITSLGIRRGMPRNADDIANILNQGLGKTLTRNDIMMAFGEKSYLLAEVEGRTVGIAGFQVENLITRMDEFVILAGVPVPPVAEGLIKAVEDSSKELQSEVGFMFLPTQANELAQQFINQGYEKIALEAIKVPAWREAATESQPPNTQILTKKLRAERVLKPL